MRTVWSFICLLLFATPGLAAISEIDALHDRAFNRIYNIACDQEAAELHKEAFLLAEQAVAADPDNYELLWRGARQAALYGEAANDLRFEGWERECVEIGKRGMDMGSRAQQIAPERVEAYFWRSYALGVYRYGLGDGITGIIAAIKEGFLSKAKEDSEGGYKADPAYLDYMPVSTYICFLSNIPAAIPVSGYGYRKARYTKAMELYDDYKRDIARSKAYFKANAYHWDVLSLYMAENLVNAVDVLKLEGAERQAVLADARWFAELGTESNRPSFKAKSQAILDDANNWD